MKQSLPRQTARELQTAVEDWTHTGKIQRLWNHDKTLWRGADEDKWLDWLDIADRQLAQRKRFEDLAAQIKTHAYTDAVLLGMGGSSLCPGVLSLTFGQADRFPALSILDSTDPAQVKSIETMACPATTLYIVSSKSGSSLEPNIFKDYFFDKSRRDGSRFIAITNPGSKMQAVAGAVAGIDIPKFLERAVHMGKLCRDPDAAKNPGVSLGLALGTLAKNGQDKITIASPAIYDLRAEP